MASRAAAVGIINSWIKPGSGFWEEQSSWSLNALPDPSQSVFITNAGWKAVAIGSNTARNFPQSMTVQELQIASPTDSYNTFLMDFAGFERPFQTTSLNIGSNSAAVVQSSALEVISMDTSGSTGNLLVGGIFSQGDFSQVTVHGSLEVRHGVPIQPWLVKPGHYFLTNGILSVGVVESIGPADGPGRFVQYGGFNNSGSLLIGTLGGYDLFDGQLVATNGIRVGSGDFATSATFYQFGGNVSADMIVNGQCVLNAGTITGNMLAGESGQRVNASITQSGGTNFALSMELGHPNRFGGAALYVLSNGVVQVDSSTLFRGGWFTQYNGRHTIASNLLMQGTDVGIGTIDADYTLAGGTLSVGGLTEQAAHFQQEGGTNVIAGDLVLGATPPYQSTRYTLAGGTLAVKNISIGTGAFFQHTGGTILHTGVLTLNQGSWYAATGEHALGPLQLSAANTNSTIIFPGGSSILRLADSSAQSWASGATLYVTNWHGSTSGGGATQLYLGSSSSGVTAQQLAQIRFNFSGTLYPATILSTGEVVPVTSPVLEYGRTEGTLILSWSPGWTLQSSTNAAGPYADVPGATSPWPASMTGAQEFFRLRK